MSHQSVRGFLNIRVVKCSPIFPDIKLCLVGARGRVSSRVIVGEIQNQILGNTQLVKVCYIDPIVT